jgi:hypothetical protein
LSRQSDYESPKIYARWLEKGYYLFEFGNSVEDVSSIEVTINKTTIPPKERELLLKDVEEGIYFR